MSLYRFGEVIEKAVLLFIDVTFLQGKKIGKKNFIFYFFILSQRRSDILLQWRYIQNTGLPFGFFYFTITETFYLWIKNYISMTLQNVKNC